MFSLFVGLSPVAAAQQKRYVGATVDLTCAGGSPSVQSGNWPNSVASQALPATRQATSQSLPETNTMQMPNVKQEAHRLMESLPASATWDDLMYTIYVRQAIEAGLEDSEAGRALDVGAVRAKFGLSVQGCAGRTPQRTPKW